MDPRTRLYLDDPTLLEFEAVVLERRALPEGHIGLVLDRSAFYPTSGGQPHDLGTLSGEPVLDVFEAEDGAVVHHVANAPAAERIAGRVDPARRLDCMQQHSGQHLLSATCVALLGRETLSFHLGAERCTIDLPGPSLTPEAVAAVEQRANEIIWEARPVHAALLPASSLGELRKAVPAGATFVRVVEIEGWDRNACCGTHVRRTSEIGIVKVLGQERVGGAARLHFVCGARALAALDAAQHRLDALARALTCHPAELADRLARLVDENKSLRKEKEALGAELARLEAAVWLAAAARAGQEVPVVAGVLGAGGEAALQAAAAALVAAGAVALVGARGARAQLLFARPEGLDVDLRPVMAEACVSVEGKGGGAAARVQGSGPRLAGLDAALAAARAAVLQRLGVPGAF